MLGLIIFGRRAVTGSQGNGTFHCPACGPDNPYTHKRVRSFFTLYFIPLIPMKTLGEYVECDRCQGKYKPEVLSYRGG